VLEPLAQCACAYSADGRVLAANASFARWLGKAERDLPGRSLFEVWPADFSAREAADLRLIARSGRVELLEDRPRPEGPRPVRTVKYPLRVEVGPEGAEADAVVVVFAEEQAAPSPGHPERLGWQALGIAHDFNNALTLLRGQVELLESIWAQGGERVAEAERVLEYATQLPRQLLAFARQAPREERPIDVDALLADLTGLLRGRAEKAGCELRLHPGAGGARVEGDAVQLTQAFLNLAGNALDAMGRGGSLTIESTRRGESVEVSFQDTGPGMTEAALARVFERLYTTRAEGTGLGLMVVSEVVRRHGGRVGVLSAPGEGTRFVVELPAMGEEPLPGAGGGAAGEGGPRQKALVVVELQPEIAQLAAMILQQAGYAVRRHGRLEEARRGGGAVDGILVDASVLDVEGAYALEGWLEEHPEAWLVVTSAGPAPVLTLASRARLRGLVNKPYSAEALLQAAAGEFTEGASAR
jgi:signal transduction histidine kinase